MFIKGIFAFFVVFIGSISFAAQLTCSIKKSNKTIYVDKVEFDNIIEHKFIDQSGQYEAFIGAEESRISFLSLTDKNIGVSSYYFDKYSKKDSISLGLLVKDINVDLFCYVFDNK